MKKLMSAALVVALTAGCGLFEPKPADGDGGGAQQGEQPQAQGGGVDPTTFVQAPGRVPVCSDAKVGWMAERTIKAEGSPQDLVESYAVVAETGDSWLIESRSPTIDAMASSFPALEGALMGLTVRKADGVVTKAVMGKPGEAGKEIKITPAGDSPATTADEGAPDRVTIGIGTFDAVKYVRGETTSWAGTSGETQGVLLKSQGGGQDYELAAAPKMATQDVGGVSVSTIETAYTNGMKMWMTDNEIIACILGGGAGADGKRTGQFRTESGGTVIAVTGLRTDAAPQLVWE